MATIANDQFETYYTEKLWAMIPDIYRYNDGLDTNSNPNVLRSLIEILAKQAAVLRRSNDRLWEDQFIDFCDDWAVPYIGKLVGTRLISAQNSRGRRIDVAKTIYYRRRKGTPRILEQLINDITGWDGKLVENFKRLVRARHGLDPQPAPLAGRFTATLPGGIADLRQPSASELVDSPFDEFFHTPDFRIQQGSQGLYGIPKLSFFIYRLNVYPVIDATPFASGSNDQYTFDPSGRLIPLFNKRSRAGSYDWDQWHTASEWELPVPIRCRLLNEAHYLLNDENIANLVALPLIPSLSLSESDLQSIAGYEFANESDFYQRLLLLSTLSPPGFDNTDSRYYALLRYAITDACGKSELLPDGIQRDEGLTVTETVITVAASISGIITAEYTAAANLVQHPVTLSDKQLAIDPKNGIFQLNPTSVPSSPSLASYYYAFSGDIGAGTYERPNLADLGSLAPVTGGGALVIPATGLLIIGDNKTYGSVTTLPTLPTNITSYFQSADQTRPFVQLATDLVFTADTSGTTNLVLDGLWIGATGGTTFNVILQGNFNCVTIRNCTLDPGAGSIRNIASQQLNPVSLIVQDLLGGQLSSITNLCIENSILGPVSMTTNGVENISIWNSILQADGTAISMTEGKINIQSVTVFGKTKVEKLKASDSIFTDVVTVTDTQDGCFRFSAAPSSSVVPKAYQMFPITDISEVSSWFNSMQFGQPDYAQLSDVAPAALKNGAYNELEMGAFNSLNNQVKLSGLEAKVEEYMPFGLIPSYINET